MTSDLLSSGPVTSLLNHLRQSTAVALLAWLHTLALRNNSARIRYAVWLLASIKFLLPFEILTYLGSCWAQPVTSNGAQLYMIVEEFTRPLRQAPTAISVVDSSPSSPDSLSLVWAFACAVWIGGFVVLLVRWTSGWSNALRMTKTAEEITAGREFDALLHATSNAGVHSQIRLLLSSAEVEPGVFGIVRPVLLWPAELSERLDDDQIQAIMVHEIEHVRRRDNLTSAIHAFVEAIFWFHPLVRWMSVRLSDERERACDERVMQQNAPPEAYAESILTVCAFCMEPAAPCVSGVSGADLKQRVLRIMTQRSGTALSIGRKWLLFTAGLLLVAGPIGFGVLHGQAPAITGDETKGHAATADLPKYEVA